MADKGLSTKWSEYYTIGRKERKTSSESQEHEVKELKAQVARILELVQEQVQQQLGTTLNAMVPKLIHGLTMWIAGGQQGPPPVPSFTASNSHSAQAAPLVSPAAPLVSPAEAVYVSPAPAQALELNAPGCTLAGTSPASGPSVSCTPAVGAASTLAELDGITVTEPLGR